MNDLRDQWIETQSHREQIVLNKLFQSEHLTQHITASYDSFLLDYVPSKISNKRIYLGSLYNKTKERDLQYYLVTKKHKIDPHNRVLDVSAIDTTRSLTLLVQMDLQEVDPSTGEVNVLTKHKANYQFGRIPLLRNSKWDVHSDKRTGPYHFTISGTARELYNILEHDNTATLVRNVKAVNGDQTWFIKRSDPINPHLLTVLILQNGSSYSVALRNSYNDQKSLKFDLFAILKLLNTSMPEILNMKNDHVTEIDLLSACTTSYQKTNDQIVDQAYAMIHKHGLDDAIEPTNQYKAQVVETYLKQNLLYGQQLSSDWKHTKKSNLLRLFKLIIDNSTDPSKSPYPDSLEHKRVMDVKDHLVSVFEVGFKQIIEKAKLLLIKQINVIRRAKTLSAILRPEIMVKRYNNYFTRGGIVNSQPFSETSSALNEHKALSLKRKVVCQLNKQLVHATYRSLNPTKVGRLCVAQTPYSRSVGLVEYLCLGTKISTHVPEKIDRQLKKILHTYENGDTPLILDGIHIGNYDDTNHELYRKLKSLKRYCTIGVDRTDEHIQIRTRSGRLLKPVYVVHKKKIALFKQNIDDCDINALVRKGLVQYLDTAEELNSIVAINESEIDEKTEYVWFNPSAYLSYTGSALPLISLNAGHRASLSLRLMDQALGSKEYKERNETNQVKVQYLNKTDSSIYSTVFDKYNTNDYIGQNLIVGFASGNVEEDAVYLNKSAVERGLMDHIIVKKIEKQSVKNPVSGMYDYQKVDTEIDTNNVIDDDGLPRVGAIVNDVPMLNIDGSKVHSPNSEFRVLNVNINAGRSQSCQITVHVAKLRSVQVGDKIGNRNGLKGIISSLTPEHELWVSTTGVYPSMCVSNHVIIRRMILGPLIEQLLSKAAAFIGHPCYVQSVPTGDGYVRDLKHVASKIIESNNYDASCRERLYDVRSNADYWMTMGPSKIYLLEHHSRDKFYVRTHVGGVNPLTKQPSEGRAVKGGLRFGQMQTNACMEYCAANFLKDRLSVDQIRAKICACGYLLSADKQSNFCKVCNAEAIVRQVKLPYAFLMFMKMLKAAHIQTRFEFETEESSNNNDTSQYDTLKQVEEMMDDENYE